MITRREFLVQGSALVAGLRLLPVGGKMPGDVLAHVKLLAGTVSKADPETATHAVVLAPCGGGEQLPPPDLLQRPTVDAFIRTTHEQYRRWVGDSFGSDVRYVFCDEPHLHNAKELLPCSRDFLREFHLDHGYRLESRIAELCFSQGAFTEVRFDFWRTVDRLFNRNFMKPLYEWCEANGLSGWSKFETYTPPDPEQTDADRRRSGPRPWPVCAVHKRRAFSFAPGSCTAIRFCGSAT